MKARKISRRGFGELKSVKRREGGLEALVKGGEEG